MPDWLGLPAEFVSVKASVVEAPSTIWAEPNALVSVGGGGCTNKHCGVTPLPRLVKLLIALGPLVKADGKLPQSTFTKPEAVEMLCTMIVQVAMPALIAIALAETVPGCVNTTDPLQPPLNDALLAPVSTIPLGKVSVKAMPDCAGLPTALAILKISVVVPPGEMDDGENALVNIGMLDPPTVRLTELLDDVTPISAPWFDVPLATLVMIVPGGGGAANAMIAVNIITPSNKARLALAVASRATLAALPWEGGVRGSNWLMFLAIDIVEYSPLMRPRNTV